LSEPHDVPTAAQLVEAVREYVDEVVIPATEGRVRFHARVAANVLGMVQRELEQGPAQALAHAEGLARLGFASDAELAGAIRTGLVDDRLDEVSGFVRATVRAKLDVANPEYLDRP
jgi:hypothetical protein